MRKKFHLVAAAALIPAISLLIWGFLIEPNQLIIKNYDLKIKKWSANFNGFKIAALSDLHAGSNFITEEKLRQIVAETNAQNPDIIVLLGDYVSPVSNNAREIKMPMPTIAENLRDLRAKYGVYTILGNTDEAYDKNEVKDEFERVGFKVLRDETASIEVNGERLRLLGMRDAMETGDWNSISAELKRILAEGEQQGYLIVLVHNPDYLPVITGDLLISSDLSLMLAGHTHGGQCRFPIIGAPVVPSEYGQKYAGGYIRDQETDMFVTTGIGTGKIPVRFGVPPEISILNIYAE